MTKYIGVHGAGPGGRFSQNVYWLCLSGAQWLRDHGGSEDLRPLADWLLRYGGSGSDDLGAYLIPEFHLHERGTAEWREGMQRLQKITRALEYFIYDEPSEEANYGRLMKVLHLAVEEQTSPWVIDLY